MPIRIGAKPDAGFDSPLTLLSDCHRRIERFLDQLIQETEADCAGPISDSSRTAFEAALRYFAHSAPLHTQDEEISLFPRMRDAGGEEARAALETIDLLEDEHQYACDAHEEVDRLVRSWLTEGAIPEARRLLLMQLLSALREMYRRHIAVEDTELFPLAGRIMDRGALEQIGREMALRRGLDPDNLPGRDMLVSRRFSG